MDRRIRKMKKIVALLLGFVLLASVCGVSLAEAKYC